MSKLISGKDALIALVNGEEVESRHRDLDRVWNNAKSLTLVESFLNPATPRDFRLKPRTITINGISYQNKDEAINAVEGFFNGNI